MYKTLLFTAISLLIAGSAQAEDINGSWTASQVTKNGQLIAGGGGGLKFVFNNGQFGSTAPGSPNQKGQYIIAKDQLVLKFTEPRKYNLNCGYTLVGKKLTYTFKDGKDVIMVVLERN